MSVRQRYIGGNLCLWETHNKRLLDAFGTAVVKYSNDFVSGPATDAAWDAAGEWAITRVQTGTGSSTITRTDAVGGALLITTDDAENDGINMQLIGKSFELTTDQRFYLGAFGLKLSDATQSDLFVGASVTNTDILAGVTDSIGFRKVDGAATLSYVVEKNSTETTGTATTLADATAVDLEFFYDGPASTLEFFVNGSSVATPALTNLPNDEALRLSIHFLTGAAAAKTFTLDRLKTIQIGR